MSSNMGSILYWVQPETGKHLYELRDGERILATIEWKNTHSRDAEGMSGDRLLSLKRRGFFLHYTAITDTGTGSEIAVFKFYGGDKGELKFRDGYKIRWKFEGMIRAQVVLYHGKSQRTALFFHTSGEKEDRHQDDGYGRSIAGNG